MLEKVVTKNVEGSQENVNGVELRDTAVHQVVLHIFKAAQLRSLLYFGFVVV